MEGVGIYYEIRKTKNAGKLFYAFADLKTGNRIQIITTSEVYTIKPSELQSPLCCILSCEVFIIT